MKYVFMIYLIFHVSNITIFGASTLKNRIRALEDMYENLTSIVVIDNCSYHFVTTFMSNHMMCCVQHKQYYHIDWIGNHFFFSL